MNCPQCGVDINPAAMLASIKSAKKAQASRQNGTDQRPHFVKLRHFLNVYPHSLECTEYKVLIPLSGRTKTGRVVTYNPDYYCPTTGYFIEVTTSKPNIAEQRQKWIEAIELGHKLKVYWWKGNDITALLGEAPRDMGL